MLDQGAVQTYAKPIWITVILLALWAWWPMGVAAALYIAFGNRSAAWRRDEARSGAWSPGSWSPGVWSMAGRFWERRPGGAPTGNAAFDAYRSETLRRLEEEREDFSGFLQRLRQARDQEEFEQFMAQRRAGGPLRESGPRGG